LRRHCLGKGLSLSNLGGDRKVGKQKKWGVAPSGNTPQAGQRQIPRRLETKRNVLTSWLSCQARHVTLLRWRDERNRVLSNSGVTTPDMNVGKCIAICQGQGLPYAGLQDSSYCFCGTDYRRLGQVTEDSCRMACVGNRAQACGGFWTNSVYATGVKGGTGQTGAASIPSQTPADCWVPHGSAKVQTNLERALGRWQMLRPDGTPTGEILTLTGTQLPGHGGHRVYTSNLGRSGDWDMYNYGGACSNPPSSETCGWIRVVMTADYANSPDLVVSKDGGTLTEYATGRLVARKLCP
jgi:hypothetical protein